MVDVDLQMGLSDIALAEIAEGKLSTEISPVVEDGFQAA
jgi:DNA-directed RNA polymerase subunit K/omega